MYFQHTVYSQTQMRELTAQLSMQHSQQSAYHADMYSLELGEHLADLPRLVYPVIERVGDVSLRLIALPTADTPTMHLMLHSLGGKVTTETMDVPASMTWDISVYDAQNVRTSASGELSINPQSHVVSVPIELWQPILDACRGTNDPRGICELTSQVWLFIHAVLLLEHITL